MSKHTPGPWYVHGMYVRKDDGRFGAWNVAEVNDAAGVDPAVGEANAALIAAAPDLCAVVKHLADLLDGAWHFENPTITVSVKGNLAREARAVRRRVEGEE